MPNPDHRLRPGRFVPVVISLDERPDVPVIDARALVSRHDGDGCFVLDPATGTVRWQAVMAGHRDAQGIEIRSPADLTGAVVVVGQHLLSDGAAVQVRDQEDAP